MEIVGATKFETTEREFWVLSVVPGSRLALIDESTRASFEGERYSLEELRGVEPHNLGLLCKVDRLTHNHVVNTFASYLQKTEQLPWSKAITKAVGALSFGFHISPDPAHAP